VHPGDCETFGLIVLEAMGCGVPAVVTTGGGIAELVDPDCGVLAQPNCADSLANAIRDACARDLTKLGAQARRKVETCFDWSQVFAQLMARYDYLLANHAHAGRSSGAGAPVYSAGAAVAGAAPAVGDDCAEMRLRSR
jgi:alpha-1,6-mannosyltransferase